MATFSRALRVDKHIFVAGTTSTDTDGLVGEGDPAKQMHFILNRIVHVIEQLGGALKDVTRTSIYVSDINHWETVAKIHGERFKTIRPVSTLVQAYLVGKCLVEVEAEAIIGSGESA